MRKEAVETGKNVEAAIDAACEKLGCSRDDCEWEILERQKKIFLGLKTVPAKVRVWIDVPEETPKPKAAPAPVKPKREAAPQPQKRVERPAAKPQEERKPAPVDKKETAPSPTAVASETVRVSVQPDEKQRAKVEATKEYIESVLKAMGLSSTLEVSYEEGGAYINIQGQGLGMIIGRRGETLDALQYLSSLVANRLEGEYLRITVDCGDYRSKRKDTLEALAKKLAAQVLKTNISKTLEPMNPFERRIIHATVSEIEGVSSLSIGEEPNRRVVITSPTAKSRNGGRRSGGGGHGNRPDSRGERRPRGPRRDGRDSRDNRDGDRRRTQGPAMPPRPSTATPPGPPKQTPETANDNPLYAKIDLE